MTDETWKKVEMGNTWNYIEEGKGAEIIGVYISKEENVGENKSIIYTLEVNGETVSVWGSTVLDVRMKNIKAGEDVKIVYLGREPSQKRKDKTYHNFDVYHRPTPMSKVEEPPFTPGE